MYIFQWFVIYLYLAIYLSTCRSILSINQFIFPSLSFWSFFNRVLSSLRHFLIFMRSLLCLPFPTVCFIYLLSYPSFAYSAFFPSPASVCLSLLSTLICLFTSLNNYPLSSCVISPLIRLLLFSGLSPPFLLILLSVFLSLCLSPNTQPHHVSLLTLPPSLFPPP